jgi:hypothetical protein
LSLAYSYQIHGATLAFFFGHASVIRAAMNWASTWSEAVLTDTFFTVPSREFKRLLQQSVHD